MSTNLNASPKARRILLELRPALEGHAGIPQETRLLFRGLCLLENTRVEGLIQHGGKVLAKGIPEDTQSFLGALSKDRQINRLARVVISIEQSAGASNVAATMHTTAMVLWRLLGGSMRLTRFDPHHFQDFIWRRFFARTLPTEDFSLITAATFRVARIPWNAMHICAAVMRSFGLDVFLRLATPEFDIMIAETPYPGTVSAGTRMIIRYHDAIPLLMPHTISDRKYHQASHYYALRKNVKSGAWFVCVSEATRKDLISVFPEVEPRTLTIHNMVSHHYFEEPSDPNRVIDIVKTRLNTSLKPPLDPTFRRHLFEAGAAQEFGPYLLIVSTIEPRKNHLALLAAWETLRVERFPSLKLIVVGAAGWRYKDIVQKFRPWMEQGSAFFLQDVPSAELRLLYKHAAATVCPSLGEGFDFSGVEAMKSGGAVVASDIPVHREIYGDAANYFNPYSTKDLCRSIVEVIDPPYSGYRSSLVARGAAISQRYGYEAILPQWKAFLTSERLAAA